MRRFLIWSGLAVVIGLVLAVSGYLAYDYFYARFQPVTIARNQGEIQRLLDEASWVSPGGGDQPLYIIGYRDSAPTQGYERQEADKLRAGGVDVRVLMFARPDKEGTPQSTAAERSTIAELWLNRDWELYRRWTLTPKSAWTAQGIPVADGNLARSAVVDASRQFVDRLDGLMRDAGVKPTWPLVIWRDREGFLKACACADPRSWVYIRDDLNAPDTARVAGPSPTEGPMTPAPVQPAPTTGLPYPNLTPLPPVPGTAPAPSSPPAQTSPAPSSSRLERPTPTPRTPARPARPATPPPPEPEDTQFF